MKLDESAISVAVALYAVNRDLVKREKHQSVVVRFLISENDEISAIVDPEGGPYYEEENEN